jgi:hypothetical protein
LFTLKSDDDALLLKALELLELAAASSNGIVKVVIDDRIARARGRLFSSFWDSAA